LYNNNLTGTIPSQIGNLIHCEFLSLANNALSGNIPNELGKLTKLKNLLLENNNLSGNISPDLGNMEGMINLSLHNNNLTGNIPSELGRLVNVINLSLDNNDLTGTLPEKLGNLPDLGYLNVCNNNLSGCYEPDLSNLCDINVCIDIGNNFVNSWNLFCSTEFGACDWVWSGDYNTDGIVDEDDMLFWGLAKGFTGPPRQNASILWERQDAPFDWQNSINNVNSKHQDGNGDGVVDDLDIVAVVDNFNKQHSNASNFDSNSNSNYDYKLTTVPVQDIGDYNYDIYLEDLDGNPTSINGLAFHLNFDKYKVDTVYIKYQNYCLSADFVFEYFNREENTYHIALMRSNKTDALCEDDDVVARIAIAIAEDSVPTDGDSSYFISSSTIQSDGDTASDEGSIYLPEGGIAACQLDINVFVSHASCTKPGSASVKANDCTGNYFYYWNTGETTSEIDGLTPGIYEIEVSNSDGDTVNKTVEIAGRLTPGIEDNSCLYDNSCPTLLEPYYISSGIYRADRTVKSNDIVPANSQVTFKAGNRIRLDSGFSIKSNAIFKARIGNCQ